MILNNREIIESLLIQNGYVDLIAHGTSMLPTISDGQQIRIRKSESFAVNDIIAYWSNDEKNVIVHRIVYIHNKKIFPKGDNNPEIERAIGIDRIIGKYNVKKA